MPIYTLPRNFIRSASWAQQDQRRNLQRSEWTGRTREVLIGPADRWLCAADIRPMKPDDLVTWRAFQTQMRQAQGFVRLPATEGSQYGEFGNLVQNSALAAGASGWLVSGVAPVVAADGEDLGFSFNTTLATAIANGNLFAPIANRRIYLQARRRFTGGSAGTLRVLVTWFNIGGASLGTSQLPLLVGSPGVWETLSLTDTAPLNTAGFRLQIEANLSAGSGIVSAVRLSNFPGRALVAAGSGGQTLVVAGLAFEAPTGSAVALAQRNLRAGQLLTVALPSGDEQMLPLVGDLVADSSGNATAQLGSPLRETPTVGATVELDQPWALMRAVDPLAWSADPGAIYGSRQLQFEEAF